MMDLTEKTVSQEYPYKGRIINMRVDQILLPNGQPASREVVEHPGGVCIAALTEDNEVLFVRQFRYPYHQVILEVPAGKRSPGEDPLECGKRELREETGASAEEYISLGTLYPLLPAIAKRSFTSMPAVSPAVVSLVRTRMSFWKWNVSHWTRQ